MSTPTVDRIAGRVRAEQVIALAELDCESEDFRMAFWRELAKRVAAEHSEPAERPGENDLTPMTDEEAKNFERHQTIKFCTHGAKAYGDIPMDYLCWLADSTLPVLKYVRSERGRRRIAREQE